MSKLPVIAHMATMPPRLPALKETLPKILPQVDHLHLYLNDFEYIPSFLVNPKITTYKSQDHLGDIGDVGKFYNCHTWSELDAYIFTMDDKIHYPSFYVEKSIETIEKYKRKAVVSFHGRNIKPNCVSYYFDFDQFFNVYDTVISDQFVHELGTGAMSFYSKLVKCDLSCFPHSNMTDIYFSMLLQKQKIPMLVAAHSKWWFKMSKLHNDNFSIHAIFNKNDKLQTDTVNSIKWKINKVNP